MKSFKAFSLLAMLYVSFMTNTSVEMARLKVTNNPGRCTFKSRGTRRTIIDINGNDLLLVCVRNNGKFTWKTLSNSLPSLGEYFDPAGDCSQIVQKRSDAKDGFYWIKITGSRKVRKVWCDVTTDGGGFMLVGQKNTPVSWTLPSYPSVVAPHGKPHWSSVLGNVPMVEFRIQISITKNPKQSRADWLYRFKNVRHLKELFMDKEGCTTSHPGIGNIEYVKDLLAEKIVNKKFNCSRFGPSNFSWNRLNKCLGQACIKGNAIFPGFLNLRYGSFSYSTSLEKSGMSYNSTAFIGCDHGKCCACFGPKGATGDFCSPRCGSINGGTVTRKAHAWFWIRSSVPKRPFLKKCMEYIVKTEQGNEETHFIDAKTGILKKGSCKREGVENLVDGVVQVANKDDLEKVPLVKGLLSYRKDNEKLYLANGVSWQPLGKEKQIEDLNNSVAQLKTQLKTGERQLKAGETQLNTSVAQLKAVVAQLKSGVAQLKAANAVLQKKVNVLEDKHTVTSCSELYKNGTRTDGVYTLDPDGLGAFKVRCDMTTDGGGWTVFQRRVDGSVDFYRGWDDYKAGFGNLNGEFWLGLDKIHRLSRSGQNVLRVDLEDFSGGKAYAKYFAFTVSNEANKYQLTVAGFSGNAGDSLSYHSGSMFTTKDKDNDVWSGNCATSYKGAWWYGAGCHTSNLNGRYLRGSHTSRGDGVNWYRWKGFNYSLKKTEMKIRPRSF